MIQWKMTGSLEKLFNDVETFDAPEIKSGFAARGEVYSFQLALKADGNEYCRIAAESELNIELRMVDSVPVHLASNSPDEDFLRTTPGLYPDLLSPLECGDHFRIMPRQWRAIWVTVRVPKDCKPGRYTMKFHVSTYDWQTWNPEIKASTAFELEVLDFELPKQQLLRYEWFHSDCIAAYYGVECWSEEHWKLVENFARNAFRHGINILYTPLWTPPLDTEIGNERPTCQLLDIEYDAAAKTYRFGFEKLERFIAMGKRCGFEHFGMSHLFTQWGARCTPKIVCRTPKGEKKLFGWDVPADDPSYQEFLTELFPQLLPVLRRNGLSDKCFFSVSDEPDERFLEPYRKAVKLVTPLLEEFRTVEALSNFKLYEDGLVRHPIPSNNHIEAFVGKVPELWTYYCCSQEQKVPNRMMAMPSSRNRIIGVLAYVYDLTGFLQWGFNFYFSQYSRRLIDPFACTDCEGGFPAGDPFMVYPGRGGEVLDSIRHEVFFEGLQDLRALRLLESKIGRDAVLALIQENVEKPLSMTEYPRGAQWLLDLRKRVYARIQQG